MSENYIGFGKWSIFYNYILFCFICNVLKDLSINNCDKLNNNGILRHIYKYFGYILFGFIFFVIFKTRLNKMNTNKDLNEKKELKNSKDAILIYNDKRYNFTMRKIDSFTLIIVCLIYVFNSEITKILDYYDFYCLDLWTMDIFALLILMYYFFPQYTYKHQIYSMLFIAVINTILLFTATFCKIFEENESEVKYKNIYKYKGTSLSIFVIFVYTLASFLIFFGRIYGKILMEKYFISPYKIIIIIGILGFFFDLIIALIFINKAKGIDCPKLNDNNKPKSPKFYCYLDVNDYFSNFLKIKPKEIFLTISYIIFSFLSLMCEIFIIKYLNPNFLLMSDNVYYIITKIIQFYQSKKRKHIVIRYIIIQIADIFEFFACLIYLELIELRFCGLNKNIKRKIIERSESEIKAELYDIQCDDNLEDSIINDNSFNE